MSHLFQNGDFSVDPFKVCVVLNFLLFKNFDRYLWILQVKHFKRNLPSLQLGHACLVWLYQRYLCLLSYLRKNAMLDFDHSLFFENRLPTEKFPICLCSSFFLSSSGVFVPLLSSFASYDLVSFCGFCCAAGAGLYSPETFVFTFV